MTRLLFGLLVLSSIAGSAGADCSHVSDWPLWQAYVEHFVSPDGRVIDYTGGDVTTSEGQSYALFFSLVANDRPLFRRLYAWTRDNLAGGRLDDRLPAYRWGRRDDRTWGIVDRNSAADSDLWIGYTLVEAGRLWRDDALARTGRALVARIVEREVADLPGLGAMLLPAPRGFVHGQKWRLNPSYLPPQLLRGLAADGVPGPWKELRANLRRMIAARARHGFVDDWVGYEPRSGFIADRVSGSIGSYDAIRVYLWHALGDGDGAVARRLDGPYQYWRAHGRVPERIDTERPSPDARPGPVGFLAVLLPRVAQSGDAAAQKRLEQQIEAARNGRLYGRPPTYYDQNLVLFAQGAVEGRYRFGRDGRLVPAWAQACRESHSSATLIGRPP
jgi:endo-1,4-beta-D-glucanase Y